MAGYRTIFRLLPMAALAAALIGAAIGSSCAVAASPSYSQDEIEAAFLYRFAGFVHWPRRALEASVFTVAVLDDRTVASDLQRMLPHNELHGRRVQVESITSIDQLGNAQILYVGESDPGLLRRWLAQIAGRPILVVTNQRDGLEAGSTINFLLVDRHVRFEISLTAARRSGLDISADLLSVAMQVQGHPNGSEPPCEVSPPRFEPSACWPRLAAR